jgi:tRNA (Thr-GGU) A37 N-methylase
MPIQAAAAKGVPGTVEVLPEPQVENVDMVDGSLLLDINPYVPEFDVHAADPIGWLEKTTKSLRHTNSDRRFR